MAKKNTKTAKKSTSKKKIVKKTAPAARAAKPAKAARVVRSSAAALRTLPIFHVDAFTRRLFHGNPACVVLVEGAWPTDEQMQSIAIENNQPMTAFVQPGKGKKIGLRWFNPVREFDLCGHATLAAAHVLWNHVKISGDDIIFATSGGDVRVARDRDLIAIELQARPAVRVRASNALCAALGREPSEVHQAGAIMAVFENKRDVHALQPDMTLLEQIHADGVIVTAPGAGHDFVSRYFAPRHGLDEDHATGSSHCTLVPYWCERLGKTSVTSHQVSHRGGEMWCEHRGDRVVIGGHAITFGKGTILV